jgi:23S rRNA pseudouridine1911/1915/1917 synthase
MFEDEVKDAVELTFVVSKAEEGFALRDALRRWAVSSTLVRSVKRAGGFFVNGAPAHTNVCVHSGDTVRFALPPEPPTDVLAQALPLDIVYEDMHTMVLNKPAGQTVHPTRGYTEGTLANAFCGCMQARQADVPFRPINRIDRGTSGLVLCAMNMWAAPLLAESVQKEYFALVPGNLPDAGVIDAPIGLEEGSIIRRCITPQGKPSRTEYTVVARGDEGCLVRCIPVTGRTHQIRVHFSGTGHPLLGDDLYGGACAMIQRPALHCGQIQFLQPHTGAQITVRQPLPPDMRALVENTVLASSCGWLLDTEPSVSVQMLGAQ